jgi:hypothetical protein
VIEAITVIDMDDPMDRSGRAGACRPRRDGQVDFDSDAYRQWRAKADTLRRTGIWEPYE